MPRKLDMAELCSALADRTRLRLLNLIRGGEVCVCYLVDVLATNQPKVSRHLAYLRRAGIVRARRDGRWIHYSLARPGDEAVARVLAEVLAWAEQDPEMVRDRERLHSTCCSEPPIRLARREQAREEPVAALDQG
jgi:ArsR family transcriptional regulator